MLSDILSNLNIMMSDFGAVLIGAVAFWLVYMLLPRFAGKPRQSTGSGARTDVVVRHFGLPPNRRGGR